MSYTRPKLENSESFLPERDALVVADRNAGLTGTQIAEKHGIKRPRVISILRRARRQLEGEKDA